MVEFKKYIAWKCPSCGTWQGKQNNKWTRGMSDTSKFHAIELMTLRCIKDNCRKTTKFRDNIKGGVRVKHFWCDFPGQATEIIKKITAVQTRAGVRKPKNKGFASDDFWKKDSSRQLKKKEILKIEIKTFKQ